MIGTVDLEARFVAYLAELGERDDRGALAALRRGLGKAPGEATEMYPYVVPWVPRAVSPAQERAFYLIAALFAWHPHSWPADGRPAAERNLGASFQRLVTDANRASVERRFVALLNTHAEDLPDRLRQAIGLLKSKDVPVDWAQLLRDLQRWDSPSRQVQRAWARSFWGESRAGGGGELAAGNAPVSEQETEDALATNDDSVTMDHERRE